MTNLPKEVIIVGGGASIKPQISQLQPILANKFTILTNYAFKHFSGTFLAFTDRDFYKPRLEANNPDVYEELKQLPLIIGIDNNGLDEFKLDNTILLNKNYKENLTGIFALKLAEEIIKNGTIYLCYSEDTEVFTDEGWKYFKDLSGKEKILTRKFNGDTEWSPILNYFAYDYNGKMKHIKAKGIDLLVTPEHSQCLIKKNYTNYIFKPINKLTTSGLFKIPKIFNWIGKEQKIFLLPGYKLTYKKSNYFRTNIVSDIKINMNDWLAFLGLYLSEGCCLLRKDKSPNTVIIYQNHTKESDEYIESILKKLPFGYSWHKRGWEIYSTSLVNYLKILGKSENKFIPAEFKKLPTRQLCYLLDSLIFGDGCKDKKGNSYYFTISKQLADDVQEIAYKCKNIAGLYQRRGRICTISTSPKIGKTSYTVYFNKNYKQGNLNYIVAGNLIFKNNINEINYSGKIYDITVKNHTLWVRRNGSCVWSGNCGFDWTRRLGLPEKDPNYNAKSNLQIHYYTKEEINHRGQGYTGYYENHNPNKLFEKFIKKDIMIYNVSLESNINCFEKISYEQFFRLVSKKIENQNELRNYIKLFYNKT